MCEEDGDAGLGIRQGGKAPVTPRGRGRRGRPPSRTTGTRYPGSVRDTCLENKGAERREGIREYVGCQEGEEGPTLTGEWAGIRERPLRDQAYACDGVTKEWAEETDPWTKEWENAR